MISWYLFLALLTSTVYGQLIGIYSPCRSAARQCPPHVVTTYWYFWHCKIVISVLRICGQPLPVSVYVEAETDAAQHVTTIGYWQSQPVYCYSGT
jgi:hypothetical protein